MSNEPAVPDFENLKHQGEEGIEYWTARELMPLLGYDKWERFHGAIKKAMIACEQVGQIVEDHFPASGKMIQAGKGAKREVKDYYLSRFACYLIAQNGDPRKPEIAAAQAYFAIATRENEVTKELSEHERRISYHEDLSKDDQLLELAAHRAGVLPRHFGRFIDAGYEGLYGGLSRQDLKEQRGLPTRAEVQDYMGSVELAANHFRVTQTTGRLIKEKVIGQSKAIETHREVGKKVREAIENIGGTMPENLPTPKESIKQLKRSHKKKPNLLETTENVADGNKG